MMVILIKREEGDRKRTTFVAVDNLRKFLGDFFHIYLLAEHHYIQSTKSYFVEALSLVYLALGICHMS